MRHIINTNTIANVIPRFVGKVNVMLRLGKLLQTGPRYQRAGAADQRHLLAGCLACWLERQATETGGLMRPWMPVRQTPAALLFQRTR